MKNKKKFWIIFSVIAILSIIPLVFLFKFWIYRAKNSYENMTEGNLSGVGFEESRMSDMVMDEPTSSLSGDDRSVIRTGNISFSVDDIDDTLEIISTIEDEYGATVTDLNDYGEGKSRTIGLTIKVEESKF